MSNLPFIRKHLAPPQSDPKKSPTNPKTCRVLVVAPTIDRPSKYAWHVAERLIDLLQSVDYLHIHTITGRLITQTELSTALAHYKPHLFLYFGHGTADDLWAGWWSNMWKSEMSQYLSNCVIYTMACFTGKELGPYLMKNGAKGFFGNTEEVFILSDTVPKIIHQNYERIWMNAVVDILRGLSFNEVWLNSQDNWNDLIALMRTTHFVMQDEWIRRMQFNKSHQIFLGQPHDHIQQYVKELSDLNLEAIL